MLEINGFLDDVGRTCFLTKQWTKRANLSCHCTYRLVFHEFRFIITICNKHDQVQKLCDPGSKTTHGNRLIVNRTSDLFQAPDTNMILLVSHANHCSRNSPKESVWVCSLVCFCRHVWSVEPSVHLITWWTNNHQTEQIVTSISSRSRDSLQITSGSAHGAREASCRRIKPFVSCRTVNCVYLGPLWM